MLPRFSIIQEKVKVKIREMIAFFTSYKKRLGGWVEQA